MTEPCSAASSRSGEPLAGSASESGTLVALAWPKPRWHPEEAVRSEGLPAELRALGEREQREGRKLPLRLFQRGPGGSTERCELLLWSRGSGLRAWPALAAAELAPEIERFLRGEVRGEPVPSPLLLVCTDGKHDRCCALHGHALHAALAAEIARRASPVGLAESSHLGGHRFAATALALPEGHLYGRVGPALAPALLAAVEAGRALAPRLRGSLGLPEPVQVAEVHLRARFPELTALEARTLERGSDALRLEVAFRAGGRPQRFVVDCARRSFASPTSCTDACGTPATAERRGWVVTGARAASAGTARG